MATRRAVHGNPELSFREAETAALVAARLSEIGGYDVTEGVAPGHGVRVALCYNVLHYGAPDYSM